MTGVVIVIAGVIAWLSAVVAWFLTLIGFQAAQQERRLAAEAWREAANERMMLEVERVLRDGHAG